MTWYSFLLFLHIIAVIIGMGSAFLSDYLFITSWHDKRFSKDEERLLHAGSTAVWASLLVMLLTGIGIFCLEPASYMASSSFIAKMLFVLILFVNGLVFSFIHKKEIQLRRKKNARSNNHFLFVSGVISPVTWLGALTMAFWKPQAPLLLIFGLYFAGLVVGFITLLTLDSAWMTKNEKMAVRWSTGIAAVVATILLLAVRGILM